jgi:metal-responsive CopG/Arc/MetJ family transcriptional regulator
MIRTRERDGEKFYRVSIDLPVNMVKDIDQFASEDQRSRADCVRLLLAPMIRRRKAQREKAA